MNVAAKIQHGIKVSWDECYPNEQALVGAMMLCNADATKSNRLVRGYEYIAGFQRYYRKHGTLTAKQMVQLKRLATAIYKHLNMNYGCHYSHHIDVK